MRNSFRVTLPGEAPCIPIRRFDVEALCLHPVAMRPSLVSPGPGCACSHSLYIERSVLFISSVYLARFGHFRHRCSSSAGPFTRPAFARDRRIKGVTLTATLRSPCFAAAQPGLLSGRSSHATHPDGLPSVAASFQQFAPDPHDRPQLLPWRPLFLARERRAASVSLFLDCLRLDSDCLYSFLCLFVLLHLPLLCEHRSGYLRSRTACAISFRGINTTSIHSSRCEYRV
jgi:hypothetical protein